jgi:hypothetical protein
MKKLNHEELLADLEVPFPVGQVLWQADQYRQPPHPRSGRSLCRPACLHRPSQSAGEPARLDPHLRDGHDDNITRTKRNTEIVTGKILVTSKVTIDGLGTHSGTGEEWADEDNAMTSAEAQAFKRACSCFGLGR